MTWHAVVPGKESIMSQQIRNQDSHVCKIGQKSSNTSQGSVKEHFVQVWWLVIRLVCRIHEYFSQSKGKVTTILKIKFVDELFFQQWACMQYFWRSINSLGQSKTRMAILDIDSNQKLTTYSRNPLLI